MEEEAIYEREKDSRIRVKHLNKNKGTKPWIKLDIVVILFLFIFSTDLDTHDELMSTTHVNHLKK